MENLKNALMAIKELHDGADAHAKMVLLDAAQAIIDGMCERSKDISGDEMLAEFLSEPVA